MPFHIITLKKLTSQSSDKPATPILTVDNGSPFNGNPFKLTCASSTPDVERYEFKLGGSIVASSASNTYQVNSAVVGQHEGGYTCSVEKSSFKSDTSNVVTVTSKSFLF